LGINFQFRRADSSRRHQDSIEKRHTSPDHGTAFSIAGKNLANPSSMIAAIRLACELA